LCLITFYKGPVTLPTGDGGYVKKMKMKPSLLDQFSITANGVVLKKDFIENSTLPASSEISICEKWLSDFAKPQSRYNNSHSSYGLKHKKMGSSLCLTLDGKREE
jgi:hypothetical protein